MKPTPENIKILKLMGFGKEEGHPDSYVLENDGWGFNINYQKNIKSLVKRLVETNYHQGRIDMIDKLPLSEKELEREYNKSDNILTS